MTTPSLSKRIQESLRYESVVSAASVFVLALLIRAWSMTQIIFPQPEDTAYYVAVARNLLLGRGLVSDALWSYGTPPLELPRAAFEVWLPLPTFLAAIPMLFFGTAFAIAQVSSVLVGSLVAVLAWRLAADVAKERRLTGGRARTLALGTGLTTAVYLPLVLHSALPDSTMPFAALVLAACLLMNRITNEPRQIGRDPRLLALGVVMGLAAWTRNEAIWLALTWVIVAWLPLGAIRHSARERLRMIAVVGAVAMIVFAPWAIRDILEFGTPFPGQALANALSIDGTDIFAWSDPPTLSRYLGVGPGALVRMRTYGIGHNLVNVLLFPGFPVSVIGLVALRRFGTGQHLRPLLIFSLLVFTITSLLFPVATTWGTFLHAAGAIHVLLIITCLLALDALIARVGEIRGWTNPVAWLGATLTVTACLLFTTVLLPTFGRDSRATSFQYQAFVRELAAAGETPADLGPIISDHPIWLADTGVQTLALPNESTDSLLEIARRFGARSVVITPDPNSHPNWADVLGSMAFGECFEEKFLRGNTDLETAEALRDLRVYRIRDACL